MAQRFDDTSKSQYNWKDDDLGTMRLAKNIRKASSSISTNVERLKYELQTFVSLLRKVKVQVTLQTEESPAKRIGTFFATSSRPISGTVRHHPDPKIRGSSLANTAPGQAAFEFCRVDSGAFLDYIILPLQGK